MTRRTTTADPPPGFSIRSRLGLLRVDRSWPSVVGPGWAATTWATVAGAQRAVDRCRLHLQAPPIGYAAQAAQALLDGCLVLPHDLAAEIWHDGLRNDRHRVEIRRLELLAGLAAVVDAARFVGPGANIDGTDWGPEMCQRRIEREIAYILEECARDPLLGEGWVSEDGLQRWVAQRQAIAK
jgi:hypothetical protein